MRTIKESTNFFKICIYVKNLLIASYLRSYLQKSGYSKVTICLNKDRFQSTLDESHPKLLLVDYEILHKEGTEKFLSFLCKKSPETYIIALTPFHFYSEAVKNLDYGLNDLLIFSTQEMITKEKLEQVSLKGLDRLILSRVDQSCHQYYLQEQYQKYMVQLQEQSLEVAKISLPKKSLLSLKQKLKKAKTQYQLLQVFLEDSSTTKVEKEKSLLFFSLLTFCLLPRFKLCS